MQGVKFSLFLDVMPINGQVVPNIKKEQAAFTFNSLKLMEPLNPAHSISSQRPES
jgi:hypothetical protein